MNNTCCAGALHRIAVVAALFGATMVQAGGNANPAFGTRAAMANSTDQLVIRHRAGAIADMQSDALQAVAARFGVQIIGGHDGVAGRVVKLDHRLSNAQVDRLAAAMKAADAGIELAQADRMATAQFVPNDTLYPQQWHYFEAVGGIKMPKAWDKSTGVGVTVAVLDTGYRPHADLVANIVPGYDMIIDTAVSNDGDGRDASALDPGDGCGGQSSWHGTHVAGTIAAVTGNGSGVAGVAFNAKVQPVRVLGCGGGYFSDVEAGIEWASGGTVAGVPANATPSRVINMSLGGFSTCTSTMQTAINNAVGRGTVVVVAAGNSNSNASGFTPANCANVITVAATNRSGGKAWYSNFGTLVEIAAPGGDTSITANGVLSTLNAGISSPGADAFAFYQGTSMASPHVAGVAALMLSTQPGWTPAQVLARMQAKARAFPAACFQCGSGIINAAASIKP